MHQVKRFLVGSVLVVFAIYLIATRTPTYQYDITLLEEGGGMTVQGETNFVVRIAKGIEEVEVCRGRTYNGVIHCSWPKKYGEEVLLRIGAYPPAGAFYWHKLPDMIHAKHRGSGILYFQRYSK